MILLGSLELYNDIQTAASEMQIFLDYGYEWELAWESHIRSWKPPKEGTNFAKFVPLTEMKKNNTAFRSAKELRENPYPDNIMTVCDFRGKEQPCLVLKHVESKSHVRDIQSGISNSMSNNLISFAMKPYSSDQHLPGAFRHHIGVHDDLWPERWKDLAPQCK